MIFFNYLVSFWSSCIYEYVYNNSLNKKNITNTISKSLPLVLFNQFVICYTISYFKPYYNVNINYSSFFITFNIAFRFLIFVGFLIFSSGLNYHIWYKFKLSDRLNIIKINKSIISFPSSIYYLYINPIEHIFINVIPLITSIYISKLDYILVNLLIVLCNIYINTLEIRN